MTQGRAMFISPIPCSNIKVKGVKEMFHTFAYSEAYLHVTTGLKIAALLKCHISMQQQYNVMSFLLIKWPNNTVKVSLRNFQIYVMSRLMGKPTICICENKGADQLRSNCEADQRLCFRYSDSAIPILSKFKISSF